MTSYTALPNSAVQAGGRPRGTTITALRDNPIAIAEGDLTAPIVAAGWHAYDRVTVGGSSTGRFYNFGVDGAVATITTPDFEDFFEYLVLINNLTWTTVGSLGVELFRDTDAAFNPSITLISNGTSPLFGRLELPDVQRANNVHFPMFYGFAATPITNSSGTITPVFMRNSMATSQKVRRVRLNHPGNTASGSVFLLRRRLVG